MNVTLHRHALEGQIVPRSLTPGYIVLSYLVSYVGAWTTLELLHRRTAGRGLYNWYLLVGSSVSMGGVAIWCMHFVGNHAIVLGDGEPELQIAYSPGYTAISFFLPVIVLLPAFLATDTRDRVQPLRIALSGVLAGLAICGMHYLGQLGIDNHDCIYAVPYVVGSALVAVLASIGALTIFFLLQASWTNSWWKRGLCAILLAGAVSGMHWLATVGTHYRFRGRSPSRVDELTNKQTVVVVIALSVAACLVLSAFAIVGQRQRRTSAKRVKQVVLACAIFDHQGRLMMTPEGTLPSQKISGPYAEPSLQEAFTVGHSVFQWAFRASRDWRSLADLVPCMRHHLHDGPSPVGLYPTVSTPTSDATAADVEAEEQALRFKEMFCTAAADLAKQIGEPLEEVGLLYDDVVITGTRETCKHSLGALFSTAGTKRATDLESGPGPIARLGPGQLLLLVRKTEKPTAARLQSHGFRFTSLPLVFETLADALQLSPAEAMAHLESMRSYACEERLLAPGVHLACFAIRASVGGSFDVLIRRTSRNLLPSRQLGIGALEGWQAALLRRLEGRTVAACLDWFRGTAAGGGSGGDRERTFATQLNGALTGLVEDVAEPLFHQAVLVAEPVQAPCRGGDESYFPGRATIIAFRLMVPIHARVSSPRRHHFVPLSFFRCQQYADGPASDHAAFVRRVQREFAPVVESTTQSTVVYRPASQGVPRLHRSPTARNSAQQRRSWLGGLSSLEKRWSDICTPDPPSPAKTAPEPRPWGGILVSQEVNVNVDTFALSGAEGGDVEAPPMGSSGTASADMDDAEIFVDRLLASVVGR